MYYLTNYLSPLGNLTVVCCDDKLTGLWLGGQKYYMENMPQNITKKDDLALFSTVKKWLDRYFSGKRPDISVLPLAPFGSEFRLEVWKILCEIPYGEVTTYGNIAKRLESQRNVQKMSSRATGVAVGHNPVSIIIPCHRVIGSNGTLTGYAGGIDNKIKLLKHEGVEIDCVTLKKHITPPKKDFKCENCKII